MLFIILSSLRSFPWLNFSTTMVSFHNYVLGGAKVFVGAVGVELKGRESVRQHVEMVGREEAIKGWKGGPIAKYESVLRQNVYLEDILLSSMSKKETSKWNNTFVILNSHWTTVIYLFKNAHSFRYSNIERNNSEWREQLLDLTECRWSRSIARWFTVR